MKKTKILVIAFGCLLAFGFMPNAGGSVNASAASVPSGLVLSGEDVRVTYDYALSASRFSPFSYYAGKTNLSGIVSAVKQYDPSLNAQEKLFENPMLLETVESGSAANGASLSLGCYSGAFSIVADGIQTTYANSQGSKTSLYFDSTVYADGKYAGHEPISYGDSALFDFTALQFDFVDLKDSSNVFSLRQTQTKNSDSASNIFTYRGKTAELRSWNALTGVHYGSAMPILFRFDPVKKQFTMGQRSTVYDITGSAQHGSGGGDGTDFGFTDFSMSEDFEVRVSFYGIMDGVVKDYWRSASAEAKQYERRGRLAVYSLNGQPVTGSLEEMTPIAEPALIANPGEEIYRDVPFVLPPLKVYDLIQGVQTLPNSVAVTGPDGRAVELKDGSFVPRTEGEYTLLYATEWNGRRLERKYRLRAVVDAEPPTIEIDGIYAEHYLDGTLVKILDFEAQDNSQSVASRSVRVFCGDREVTSLLTDGFLKVEAGNRYRVVYDATDSAGLSAESVIEEFDTYTLSVPGEDTMELSQKAQYLFQPDLLGDAIFRISVYEGKDSTFSAPLAENVASFQFPRTGDYLIRYEVAGLGENVFQKEFVTVVHVVDTTPPTIELSSRYQSVYTAGDTISLIDAETTDNSGETPECRITVTCDGKEVKLAGKTLKLDKSGEYTITYTATDASGNPGTKIVKFRVNGVGIAAWKWIVPTVCGSAAIVAGLIVLLAMRRKHKKMRGGEQR